MKVTCSWDTDQKEAEWFCRVRPHSNSGLPVYEEWLLWKSMQHLDNDERAYAGEQLVQRALRFFSLCRDLIDGTDSERYKLSARGLTPDWTDLVWEWPTADVSTQQIDLVKLAEAMEWLVPLLSDPPVWSTRSLNARYGDLPSLRINYVDQSQPRKGALLLMNISGEHGTFELVDVPSDAAENDLHTLLDGVEQLHKYLEKHVDEENRYRAVHVWGTNEWKIAVNWKRAGLQPKKSRTRWQGTISQALKRQWSAPEWDITDGQPLAEADIESIILEGMTRAVGWSLEEESNSGRG